MNMSLRKFREMVKDREAMGLQRVRHNLVTEQQQQWGGCVCVCVCVRAHAQSCPTLCNLVDYSLRDPLSMEFSRQEYIP